MKNLNQDVNEYITSADPTKSENLTEWTVCKKQLKLTKALFKKQCDGVLKKRVLVKKSQKSTEITKIIKLENIKPKRKRKNKTLTKENTEDNTNKVAKKDVCEEKKHNINLVLKDEIDNIDQISDMNPTTIEEVIEKKEYVDSNPEKLVETC